MRWRLESRSLAVITLVACGVAGFGCLHGRPAASDPATTDSATGASAGKGRQAGLDATVDADRNIKHENLDGDSCLGMDSGADADADGDGSAIRVVAPKNPWIAFIRVDPSGFGQLFFVRADGSAEHEYRGHTLLEDAPDWSSDGRLAFIGQGAGATELHVLDFTTGTDTVVPTNLAAMLRPRWSPEGGTIVVSGRRPASDEFGLYRVVPSTGNSSSITEPRDREGGHDYGPDGRLYFVRNPYTPGA